MPTLSGIIDNNDFLTDGQYEQGWTINIFDLDSYVFTYSDFRNYLLPIDGIWLESSSMDFVGFRLRTWDLRFNRPFVLISETKLKIDVEGLRPFADKSINKHVPDYYPTRREEVSERQVNLENKEKENAC